MLPKNWFVAIDDVASLDPSRGIVGRFLDHVCRVYPEAQQRRVDLSSGRRLTLLHDGATSLFENANYLVLSIGPRPSSEAHKQRLAAADTPEALRQICSSPDGEDNSLLVVDKTAGVLLAYTGPVNVTKVFCGEFEGRRILSSSMSLFPRECLSPNAGAVASLVLNGCCLNGHTVFREIALLARASCHEFRSGDHQVTSYWQFAIGQKVIHSRSRRAATGALWELIVQSLHRVTAGKRVLLALSGGYDSGVLLGILGRVLKHPAVTCFSYAYGAPRSESDASVASQRAALFGFEHIAINSYSGGLIGMLDRNAEIGQGLRCPSYEIEAFPELHDRHGDQDTVMLFGDECLGWGSYRLKEPNDVLGAIMLKAPKLLDACFSQIDVGQAGRLRDGLQEEYARLSRRAEGFASPDDAKDFLYLDQRLQFHLLPLRTFIAGQWFPVAMPLISMSILDFMTTVPIADRVDKRLFKRMARQFLPDLFRIQPATRGQLHPDFDRELVAARTDLDSTIATREWKIDGLVRSADLSQMLRRLEAQVGTRATNGGGRQRLRGSIKKRAKAMLLRTRFLEERQHWFRRLALNDFSRDPGFEFQLLNLLFLADLFARKNPSEIQDRSEQANRLAHR